MSGLKPDLDAMHRLLHRHEWANLGDWVQALGALADLTEQEIEIVVAPAAGDAAVPPPQPRLRDLQRSQPTCPACRSIQPPPSRRAPR